jgi:small nuclear ribonucleoprotein (snRNP)-like protein
VLAVAVQGAPNFERESDRKGKRRRLMRKKAMMLSSLGLTLVVMLSATFFALPVEVEAKAKVVAVEGVSYNVDASMADNLKSFIGKKVYVTFDSGKTFAGFVKAVGNHFIHLEKLDGKDFFDALIRIENISAIDARFRSMQR